MTIHLDTNYIVAAVQAGTPQSSSAVQSRRPKPLPRRPWSDRPNR